MKLMKIHKGRLITVSLIAIVGIISSFSFITRSNASSNSISPNSIMQSISYTTLADSQLATLYKDAINIALNMVIKSNENNIVFKKDSSNLSLSNLTSDVIIRFTDRKSFAANPIPMSALDFLNNIEGDGFSALMAKNGKKLIFVNILMDEVFYEKTPATNLSAGGLRSRPDAFIRLAVVLGHELYGNVVTMLKKFDEKWYSDQRPLTIKKIQIRSEILAFNAGIRFIDRALSGPISATARNNYMAARDRETKMLNHFKGQAQELGLTPEQIVENPLQ